MSCNHTISKEWLKDKYWNKELTYEQMAKLRNVKPSYIQDLIHRKYDLSKKGNGLKIKGKRGYKMPEPEKEKHRIQKYAKEVLVFKGKSKDIFACYSSITAAAKALNIRREHVRDCLSLKKKRKTAFGFRFEYKKYRGEIIIQRRNNLDFTLEFEKVTLGLLAGLPKYPREDRINHYNKKLKVAFEKLGY